MRRSIITSLCVAACVTVMVAVVLQQNRIAKLKAERAQVMTRYDEAVQASLTNTPDPVRPRQPDHSPPIELLRLRAEVARLINRKSELARVPAESERLRIQLATRSTNAPGSVPLPAGYIKKSSARFMGYNTPEDALQSFLWAVQNRDAARLLEAVSPDRAERLQNQLQTDESKTRFFDDINQLPGFLVAGRKVNYENFVALLLHFGPGQGDNPTTMEFQRINGQWKLVSGL